MFVVYILPPPWFQREAENAFRLVARIFEIEWFSEDDLMAPQLNWDVEMVESVPLSSNQKSA